jgi:hypothetical protein
MSKAGTGQLICVILLAVFIGVSFFGKTDTLKTAEEIAEAVTADVSTEGLQLFDGERLSSQLGLDGEKFGSFVYYGSEDIMDVREILIIRGAEDSDLEAAAELIGKKAEEKYNTYKDYDPVASALLEKRVIEVRRGAIIYIVHDSAAAGLEAFLKCVEE